MGETLASGSSAAAAAAAAVTHGWCAEPRARAPSRRDADGRHPRGPRDPERARGRDLPRRDRLELPGEPNRTPAQREEGLPASSSSKGLATGCPWPKATTPRPGGLPADVDLEVRPRCSVRARRDAPLRRRRGQRSADRRTGRRRTEPPTSGPSGRGGHLRRAASLVQGARVRLDHVPGSERRMAPTTSISLRRRLPGSTQASGASPTASRRSSPTVSLSAGRR